MSDAQYAARSPMPEGFRPGKALHWGTGLGSPQCHVGNPPSMASAWALAAVAEKRGVQIFECRADGDGKIPDYNTRRKIEKQVTKFRLRTPDRLRGR